ncbi:MAG: hypothetical protein LKJ47_06700 [Bifidobacteriaceae bacterium]|jgi:nitrite reductase (NO-forming)|nr:hypothetical protein [Bifidobacteriaceae bacterium]
MSEQPRFPSSSPQRGLRGRWSDDHFTLAWMLIAVVTCVMAIVAPGFLVQPLWTPLHAIALGVVSNGIFQWSWFFSRGLLHFPLAGVARYSTFVRIVVLNVGIMALFAAMWTGNVPTALTATVLICAAGVHQGVVLAVEAHRAKGNRYAPMVRYYAVAFFLFVLTCLIGGLLAYEMMASRVPAWLVAYADGIAVAHSIIGVGGWAGITILGTVVTLGLSMLHARQDSRALTSAQSALPLFLAAVVVASIGGVAGLPIMVGCGVLAFLAAAVGGIVAPLWRSFGVRKRSSHAVWPLLAGLVWTIVLLAAFAVEAFVAESVSVVRTEIIDQLGVFLAAGIGQIFVASLAYLVPVAIGGGPTVQRVGDVAVSFLWPVRLMVRNAALVLLLLGGAVGGGISGTVRTYLLVIVVATYAVDVVLVAFSAVRQLIAKRTKLEAKAIAKGRNMTMMKSTEKKAEGGND